MWSQSLPVFNFHGRSSVNLDFSRFFMITPCPIISGHVAICHVVIQLREESSPEAGKKTKLVTLDFQTLIVCSTYTSSLYKLSRIRYFTIAIKQANTVYLCTFFLLCIRKPLD